MALVVSVNDLFTDITKTIDEVEQRIAFMTDRDELGDALCSSVEIGHRVSALTARLGLLATNNAVAAVHGQRTVGQYVAARTNSQAIDVDRKVKRAKWLRDFPIFEAAHGVELTDAHVDHLRKTLDGNYETRSKLAGDQQVFVDTAASCSFKGFLVACAYWLTFIDPDGKEPIDQIENSGFRVGRGRGGRGELKGTCDAATAQQIETAVDCEAEKLRKLDKANGIERTDNNRRMAALAALVKKGFARDDGTFPVPLGNIVMSKKVAEWALATLSGNLEPGDHVPVDANDVDGRCELIDGTPIHPFLAVQALGLINSDGVADPVVLRRYVLEANSRVLDVSVNARVFPEWMRTAALVQSRGGCETLGCDAPHSWLQMDHVEPHSHGGETRFDNVQSQCGPDNQAKGAATGRTPWRNQQSPPRRKPRRRPAQQDDDDPEKPGEVF